MREADVVVIATLVKVTDTENSEAIPQLLIGKDKKPMMASVSLANFTVLETLKGKVKNGKIELRYLRLAKRLQIEKNILGFSLGFITFKSKPLTEFAENYLINPTYLISRS